MKPQEQSGDDYTPPCCGIDATAIYWNPESTAVECHGCGAVYQYVQPLHKCEPLARGVMDEGRDWWIGKLLGPVPNWPKETHCLHMKTPAKDVIFLCNSGDFEQLLVMSNAVVDLKNLAWLESMTRGAIDRARKV